MRRVVHLYGTASIHHQFVNLLNIRVAGIYFFPAIDIGVVDVQLRIVEGSRL